MVVILGMHGHAQRMHGHWHRQLVLGRSLKSLLGWGSRCVVASGQPAAAGGVTPKQQSSMHFSESHHWHVPLGTAKVPRQLPMQSRVVAGARGENKLPLPTFDSQREAFQARMIRS